MPLILEVIKEDEVQYLLEGAKNPTGNGKVAKVAPIQITQQLKFRPHPEKDQLQGQMWPQFLLLVMFQVQILVWIWGQIHLQV